MKKFYNRYNVLINNALINPNKGIAVINGVGYDLNSLTTEEKEACNFFDNIRKNIQIEDIQKKNNKIRIDGQKVIYPRKNKISENLKKEIYNLIYKYNDFLLSL